MKVYRVIFGDGRQEHVVADTWSEVVDESTNESSIVFFANGQPIPDVYFEKVFVKGINVVSDNADDLYRWRR